MKSIGQDYVALKARVAELERQLAAERVAREGAQEQRRHIEDRLSEATERNLALLARVEQTEQQLGSWRAETGAGRPEDAGAAIRNTREDLRRAEREWDEARDVLRKVRLALACDGAEQVVSRAVDVMASRERAEATLREERAKLPATLEQVRQAFAARGATTPGGGLAGILAGVEVLADRAERAEAEAARLRQQREEDAETVRQAIDARMVAEADNAALLEGLRDMLALAHGVPGHGVGCECPRCVAARKVVNADHPGASLLERLRALEEVRGALGSGPLDANVSDLHYSGPELRALRVACLAADALKGGA
jgi:DNA repair exonuclease SbcCD ATPase subunit